MKEQDPISLALTNRRLSHLRKILSYATVHPGWIRFMRNSLNMTLKQLAERAGLSTPTIAQAERTEAAGTISISTLKKMAHAMECELVYAFVPQKDIEAIMKDAAIKKAKNMLVQADVHMTLEDQKVREPFQERVEHLANKLIKKGTVW